MSKKNREAVSYTHLDVYKRQVYTFDKTIVICNLSENMNTSQMMEAFQALLQQTLEQQKTEQRQEAEETKEERRREREEAGKQQDEKAEER